VNFSSITGVIPVRAGSKGIPGKNLKLFCGKPLVVWTIEQMQAAGIQNVIVTTDSLEIASIAKQSGARIVIRPDELSTDLSSSEGAIMHALVECEVEKSSLVIFAQATSPVRHFSHFKTAIELFSESDLDSMFSACRIDDLTSWTEAGEIVELDKASGDGVRTPRQLRPRRFVETGSFYLTMAESLLKSGSRLSGATKPFEVPKWTMNELDEAEDWNLCEILMREYVL